MRNIIAAALMLSAPIAFTPTVFAQNAAVPDAAQTGPQNPAMKGMHENNADAPVKGANSFTRAEAKKQIEAKGYTHVARLAKDKDGVWRGTAQKDGASGPVSVDYQGNVN